MTAAQWGEVICCSPSPAELFLVSGPVVSNVFQDSLTCFEIGHPLWQPSNLPPLFHCYIHFHHPVAYVNKRILWLVKVIIVLSPLTFFQTECSDNESGVQAIMADREAQQLEGDEERFHPWDFILWHQHRLRLLYEQGSIIISDVDRYGIIKKLLNSM